METIYVPRLSILTKDMDIFTNIVKFSDVTRYVPRYVRGTYQSSYDQNKHIEQANGIPSFMRSLRKNVIKTTRRNDYEKYEVIRENDEHYDTLFSSDLHTNWRQHKKTSVQLIKKHQDAMTALKDARTKCWKSMDKVKKYSLIIETQTSALKHNQSEAKVRTKAIKDMEIMLNKWKVTNEKNDMTYEKNFMKEISLREKMARIAADVNGDMIRKMKDAIAAMMQTNRQELNDLQICQLAEHMYKQTCREYEFEIFMANHPVCGIV